MKSLGEGKRGKRPRTRTLAAKRANEASLCWPWRKRSRVPNPEERGKWECGLVSLLVAWRGSVLSLFWYYQIVRHQKPSQEIDFVWLIFIRPGVPGFRGTCDERATCAAAVTTNRAASRVVLNRLARVNAFRCRGDWVWTQDNRGVDRKYIGGTRCFMSVSNE